MLRIVAGSYAGRRIESIAGIRPSTERLREAVFSIWQTRIPHSRFLDLFCGSGAMGLEASSRGADRVLLADSSRKSLAVVKANLAELRVQKGTVRFCRVPSDLRRLAEEEGPFDAVFADPPYDFDDFAAMLEALPPLLTADAAVAVEHRKDIDLVGDAVLVPVDRRVYGQSAVTFFVLQDRERSRNDVSSR